MTRFRWVAVATKYFKYIALRMCEKFETTTVCLRGGMYVGRYRPRMALGLVSTFCFLRARLAATSSV